MHLRLPITLLAICAFLPLRADWQRPAINYPRTEYAAGSQNWMAAQHPNGWLYFANNKGLLEFDGEIWSTYSMNGEKTRALCIGGDGTIYVGGMRKFGCFTANGLGGLDYHALSDRLPGTDRFSVIWNILADDDRIYFQSDWEIYCYYKSGDSLRPIGANRNIKRSALIGGKLYIADTAGLAVLNGDHLLPLPGTHATGSCKTVALLPFGTKDNVLIVTDRNGLFVYDGHTTERLRTAADGFLAENRIFCAAIHGRTLVLGSIRNGVQIVDLEKNRTENISTNNGLQNKTVLSLAFDRCGDLWLGLDNGIDCIRMQSPLATLYGGKPVIGSGYAACIYRGRIYYGTNQGLYRSDIATDPGTDMHMEQIGLPGGQIWDLAVHDDKLFCSADTGLFILSEAGIEQLPGIRGIWSVVSMNRPDRLLAGTYAGLYLLTKEEGRWRVGRRLDGLTYSCKNLFVESGSVLWVSNKGDGLYRLTLSDDLGSILRKENHNSPDIPADRGISFAYIGSDLVVTTPNGLFRYDQIRDELEPFEALEKRLAGKKYYRLLRQTADGTLWYALDESLYRSRDGRSEVYLHDALIEGFEHLCQIDDTRLIVGTEDGFASLRISAAEERRSASGVEIRRVFVHDSLIYGRSYRGGDTVLRIPYSQNSLRFVCSTDDHASPRSKRYSYRLSNGGGNGSWTEYGESNCKEYTDLHEGTYTFEVRIPETGAAGQPAAASLAFRILPPWYRSPLFYGIYLLAILGLAGCLYRYVYGRQQGIIRAQQQVMRSREIEFEEETRQRNRAIEQLKEENIRSELRHKTEELARSTLNITRKNEILQKIRKEAGNLLKAAKEEDIVYIRRSIARLIDNIDNNLDHDDIQLFEKAFDSLHDDFFSHLNEQAPNLSKQEKMMCAYIRTGMLSKEIAPLLNISVRGVEISRYRLRKKFNLKEGASLAAFLQSL